ncbi:hypothetical protein TM233_67410 [Bradyrhizobium sp. TM233]|nr:hypothetical protein TM233_67410 [Bradyrhizobium sp. TM233]
MNRLAEWDKKNYVDFKNNEKNKNYRSEIKLMEKSLISNFININL